MYCKLTTLPASSDKYLNPSKTKLSYPSEPMLHSHFAFALTVDPAEPHCFGAHSAMPPKLRCLHCNCCWRFQPPHRRVARTWVVCASLHFKSKHHTDKKEVEAAMIQDMPSLQSWQDPLVSHGPQGWHAWQGWQQLRSPTFQGNKLLRKRKQTPEPVICTYFDMQIA